MPKPQTTIGLIVEDAVFVLLATLAIAVATLFPWYLLLIAGTFNSWWTAMPTWWVMFFVATFFFREQLVEWMRTRPRTFQLSQETMFSHVHIIGMPDAGKTSVLAHMFLELCKEPNRPGIILVDHKRVLIESLTKLKIFEELKDRLIILSPRDNPALNVFDLGKRHNEAAIAQATKILKYLFSTLRTDMTGKQETLFDFVIPLMFEYPKVLKRNATVNDMFDLLEAPNADALKVIRSLPMEERRFFDRDFNAREFKETREQVRSRLQGLIKNRRMRSLFVSQKSAIDMFEEMQKGSIILVDCAEDLVPDEYQTFGRIIIALVHQVIKERVGIPPNRRHPCFLIVDEAASYMDANTEQLFEDGRQAKVGLVVAHHNFTQHGMTPALKSALLGFPMTKFAASIIGRDDAALIAREMGIKPEVITMQARFTWTFFIRGKQPPVSVVGPYIDFNKEPKMDRNAHRDMLKANQERVGMKDEPKPAPPPPEEPGADWTEADDLALADALAQLALALRRKDTKRAAELQDHINSLLKRKNKGNEGTYRF